MVRVISSGSRPRPWRRAALLLAGLLALATTAILAPAAAAHIREIGSCDPYGYCEYFYGNTVESSDHTRIKDPINVVWYPWGSWDPNVKWIMENEMYWPYTNGSSQDNFRLRGTMSNLYWEWAPQAAQRASASEGARWHLRAFVGHTHDDPYYNWSISDSHHDNVDHSGVDVSWQEAEEKVREREAVVYGRDTVANWTYLPRADSCFQGYCYNGWPARINSA